MFEKSPQRSKWSKIKQAAVVGAIPGLLALGGYISVLLATQSRPSSGTEVSMFAGVFTATAFFLLIGWIAKIKEVRTSE